MKATKSIVLAAAALLATPALAVANQAFITPVAAPTLDEIGLGALVVLLGVVGGFIARRKK